MSSLRKHGPWVLLAAFSLPVLSLVLRHGVDVPREDQWIIANTFLWGGSWKELFLRLATPHNESLLLVPKTAWFVLASLFGWNLRLEPLLSLGVALATGALLISLLRVSFPRDDARVIACTAVVSAILFNLSQWFNFLRGDQLCMFLVLFSAVAAARISVSKMEPARILLAGGAIALFATLSFANGVLCAAVPPAILLLRKELRLKKNAKSLAIYAVYAACLVALASWVFFRHISAPDFTVRSTATPGMRAGVLLSILADPILFTDESSPETLKAAGLLLLLLVPLVWMVRRSRGNLAVAAPWLSLAAIGFCNAAAIAAFRGGLSPRIETSPILFLIALFPLWHCFDRSKVSGRRLVGGALAFSCLLLYSQYGKAEAFAWQWRQSGLAAKAALHFLPFNLSPEIRLLLHEHGDPRFIDARAIALNESGYLNPALASSAEVDLETAPKTCRGSLDAVTFENGLLFARGWAPGTDGRSPADAVLLGRVESPKSARIEAILPVEPAWGFGYRVKLKPGTFRAWAYDTTSTRLWPLCGELGVANAR